MKAKRCGRYFIGDTVRLDIIYLNESERETIRNIIWRTGTSVGKVVGMCFRARYKYLVEFTIDGNSVGMLWFRAMELRKLKGGE